MALNQEYEIVSPPPDGISQVCFAASGHLAASCWDGHVYLYDGVRNVFLNKFRHFGGVLSCKFPKLYGGVLHPSLTATTLVSGSLDKSVRWWNVETGQERILGAHNDAVKCVDFLESEGVVMSVGWDMTLKGYDLRKASPIISQLPGKAYTIAHHDKNVVVATSGNKILVFDPRNLSTPSQIRESPLQGQIRCMGCLLTNEGFACGSTEGRIAIEYFDSSPEVQKNKYSYKCHRVPKDGLTHVYPVNSISFHPFGTFASGGCDGIVNVWDWVSRKRVYQFRKYPTSVSSLDFSGDGSLLAIASSYTFEDGEKR